MSADILSQVASLHTLEQAMQWAFARNPPAELVNVVTQDEFTHDVIIKAGPDKFLVFDTT